MPEPRVPALDLQAEYREVREEVEAAVLRVLASGRYVGGPEIESLEKEFAAFCGARWAVAVSSGTDALRFALLAAGAGRDDEVVTTPFTFIGTTEAVSQTGARPAFADIEPECFTLDPGRLAERLGARARVILPVHLYGQPADMQAIDAIARERGLTVVEDACQAHGAALGGRRAGALGRAGCFSFYPTKNLGAAGEGGMVTTSDPDIAERVRRLRDHGQTAKYRHAEEGYNGRMDALQAAVLRVKLRRLESWNRRRQALAARYADGLAAAARRGLLHLPGTRAGAEHVYHLYAVRVPHASGGARPRRDRVRDRLREEGIETGVHYPVPLHRQPAYAWMGLEEGSFPEAERAAREVLTLPLYPQMTEAQADRVVDSVARAVQAA